MCYIVPKVLAIALIQHVSGLQLTGNTGGTGSATSNGTLREGHVPKVNNTSVAASSRLVRHMIADVNERKSLTVHSDGMTTPAPKVNERKSLTVVAVQSDGMTTPAPKAPKLTRSMSMREEAQMAVTVQSDGMSTPAPKLTRSSMMRQKAPLQAAVVRAQSVVRGKMSSEPRQLIRHYTVTQSVDDPLAAVVRTSVVAPLWSNTSVIRHATIDAGQILYSNVTDIRSAGTTHVDERSDGAAVASLKVEQPLNTVARFKEEAAMAHHMEDSVPLWLALILAALTLAGLAFCLEYGLGFPTPHSQSKSQSPDDIKRKSTDPQCSLLQKALVNIRGDNARSSVAEDVTASSARGDVLAKIAQAWFKTQEKQSQEKANTRIARSYETQSATEASVSPEYINRTLIEKDGTLATPEEQELRAKALEAELQQGRL